MMHIAVGHPTTSTVARVQKKLHFWSSALTAVNFIRWNNLSCGDQPSFKISSLWQMSHFVMIWGIRGPPSLNSSEFWEILWRGNLPCGLPPLCNISSLYDEPCSHNSRVSLTYLIPIYLPTYIPKTLTAAHRTSKTNKSVWIKWGWVIKKFVWDEYQ